jgi:hypothetical protein
VTFETGSHLSRIEAWAFFGCSSLSSICIPAPVEILGKQCFCRCQGLSIVTLEPGSRLPRIEKSVFSDCSSLSSICSLRRSRSFAAGVSKNAERFRVSHSKPVPRFRGLFRPHFRNAHPVRRLPFLRELTTVFIAGFLPCLCLPDSSWDCWSLSLSFFFVFIFYNRHSRCDTSEFFARTIRPSRRK